MFKGVSTKTYRRVTKKLYAKNIYFQNYTPPDVLPSIDDTNLTKNQLARRKRKLFYNHLKEFSSQTSNLTNKLETPAPVRPNWAIPKKPSTNKPKDESPQPWQVAKPCYIQSPFTQYIPPTFFSGKLVIDAIASCSREMLSRDQKREKELTKARNKNESYEKWAKDIAPRLKKCLNQEENCKTEELYKEFKQKIKLFRVDK